MVIAHKTSLRDELPLLVATGDYTDQQFQDSVNGARNALDIGLNISLPDTIGGHKVFEVTRGMGGRVEYRLTDTGQAQVIKTSKRANGTQALARIVSVIKKPRKHADLVQVMAEVMFDDGEVSPALINADVRPMPRAHNRWEEEKACAEALSDLTIGHYYVIEIAGPRRSYTFRMAMPKGMSQLTPFTVVNARSFTNRDGLVVWCQDMDAEANPTPEGERNSVTGDYEPVSGSRFYRAITYRSLERFQANWDLIMGADEPASGGDEAPDVERHDYMEQSEDESGDTPW